MSKFVFGKPVFIAAALVAGFAFFGCEIGLGPAVDTEAPEVEVSSPDVNQAVSSDILITGTCKDDGEIDRVEIVAIRSVDGGIKYEARSADGVLGNAVLTSGNSWQIPLTYTNGKYYFGDTELNLPDGTYIVDVKAYDGFNRPSTVASRSFDIDNTPPIFILSSPTSLDNAEGMEYGRTVKLTGTIADAHEIDRLEIVKIYDENWNEISGLAQTVFTGFDKSNTSIVIAKYSESGEAGLSAEDLKLHRNYMAMFGSTDDKFDDITAVGARKINLAVKIWDKAGKNATTGKEGNAGEYVYISSGLKRLVSSETSIGEGTPLEAMDYMAVYNGSYNGASLNAADVAKVRAALKNENPTYNSTYKYISYNGDGARLSFSVDPNNSPKYTISGFEILDSATGNEKAPSSWNKTTTGSWLTVNLSGGKDGGGVYPNTLNVKIYKVDSSGNTGDLVVEYDSTHNADKFKTNSDASGTSVFDISASVPQASYVLGFPDGSDISSAPGVYYKFVVTGTDDNGNDLVPGSTGGYGFGIVMSGTPPYLTSDKDKSFVGRTTFNSDSNFPVYYNDADKSVAGHPLNGGANGYAISYKVYRYEGHFGTDEAKAKLKESEDLNQSPFTSGNIPSSSLISVGGSQTQFSTNIPLTGTVDAGKDYTFVIDATSRNYQNGGEVHYIFLYYIDGKPPVLSLNNAAELGGKKINRSSTNVSSETGASGTVYRYELRGTVSDVGGSGVESVELSFDGGNSFVNPSNDVSNVTSPAAVWTYIREVADGSGQKIWIRAKDNSDNESAWQKFEDITMDFTPPTMGIDSINDDSSKHALDEYYKGNTKIKFKGSDIGGTGVAAVDVKIYKHNGTDYVLASGASGGDYTNNGSGSDSYTFTLLKTGKYKITAKAKDNADQWSDEIVVTTFIDMDAPSISSVSVNETANNGYYTNTTLPISLSYTETGSGLAKALYYIENSNNVRVPSGDVWSETVASGNGGSLDITVPGFTSDNGGSNRLHVKLVDKAGNVSGESQINVKIDKGAPKVSAKYMGYTLTEAVAIPGTIYHKGSSQPFYLYGTSSDEGGIDSVVFTIGSSIVSPAEIKYTDSNVSIDNAGSFTNASTEWKSIGDIGAKYNIKGWRAKFSDPADGKLTVTARDVAGLETSVEEFVNLQKDITPPVLSGINLATGGTITENNLVDGIFTLQGTWSDEGGSGTSELKYKIDGGDFVTVQPTSAPKTTTAVKWFIEIPRASLTSGDGHSISIEAKDSAENPTTLDITGIKCDYEAPGLVITEVDGAAGSVYNDIYGKSSSSLTFTLHATDDWGVQSITTTKKELNGAESNAATLSAASGTDISKTSTLSIPRNGTADGVWNIVVKSVDKAGRDSSPVTITTRIDGTAPTIDSSSLKIGNNAWDESGWYNSETLRITGTTSDSTNGSGVSKVYYRIAEASASTPSNLDDANEKSVDVSSAGTFDIALSDFANGTNKVFFQAIDKAGNRSATVIAKTLKVDRTAPAFDSKFYRSDAGVIETMPGVAYIKSGMTQIYLYGTVSDTGLDKIEFKLGNDAITPDELLYTKAAPLETDASFAGANFNVAGTASDKSECTGWRAKFTYSTIGTIIGNNSDGLTLSAVAKDLAGNVASLTNITKFKKDNDAPALTIVSPADGDTITEEMFSDEKLTVSGRWSDVDGSGTKTLEWCLDGSSFVSTDVNCTEAVAESQWSFKVPRASLPEGSGNIIYVRAMDAIGNVSEIKHITNPYDYHAPTITIASEPEAYYGKADGPLVLTFNATDSMGIEKIEVFEAKRDGVSEDLSAGATTTVNSTTGTATVSLPRDGSVDGKWSIKMRAKDKSGRDSELLLVSTTIDCSDPTVSVAAVTVDNNPHSSGNWYSANILRVGASARDSGAGLDHVDYKVVGSNDAVLSNLVGLKLSDISGFGTVGVSGKDVDKSFTVMPTDLSENSGTVFSKLLLQSVDLAGNRSEVKVVDLNIDHNPPTAESNFYKNGSGGALNVAGGTIMNNGSSDLYIYGNVSDTLSGVKSIELKTATGDKVTADIKCSVNAITSEASSVVDSSYTISMPSASGNSSINSFRAVISSSNLPSGIVNVEVVDGAGNLFRGRLFSLEIDSTFPTIELRTPQTIESTNAGDTEGVAKLNGTVNIDGAAADQNLASVKLSLRLGDSGGYDSIGDLQGSDAYNWKLQNFEVSKCDGDNIQIRSTAGGAFVNYTGGQTPMYLKVVAEDSAGNATTKIFKYIIDPNSDRPEIRLNNIVLKEGASVMDANTRVWLKSKIIYGIITDDDGAVQEFKYSFNNSTWTDVTLSNGTWNMTVNDDGHKEIYFKVKDATGSEFISKISGDQYTCPVLTDGTNTPAISALCLKVDTELPEVKDLKFRSATAAGLSTADKETDFTSGKFGGPNYEKAEFFITAKDKNGIKKVRFQIDSGTTEEVDGVPLTDSAFDQDHEYSAAFVMKPGLSTGSHTLKVTAIDQADGELLRTVAFNVDNEPPTVTLTVPTIVTEGASVLVKLTEIGTETYFAVTKDDVNDSSTISGTLPDDTVYAANKWVRVKGTDNSMSPYIFFDGADAEEEKTHSGKFRDYLNELGIVTDPNEANPNKTVNLHIMSVDPCGNVGYGRASIEVDPFGDKPEVNISYPGNNSTLGGEIVVAGTSLDLIGSTPEKTGVDTVGIMMDVDGSGTWTKADAEEINSRYSGYQWIKYENGTVSSKEWAEVSAATDDFSKYALKATSNDNKTAWTFTINEEFNPVGNESLSVNLWVFAVDKDGKSSPIMPIRTSNITSEKMKRVAFVIDSDAPTMQNETLVNSDNASIHKPYVEGDSVRGAWFFEADIVDNEGISKIQVGDTFVVGSADSSTAVSGTINSGAVPGVEIESITNGFHIKMLIGANDTSTLETVNKRIKFWEIKTAGAGNLTKNVIVNIDNVAPAVAASNADGYNIKTAIANMNGFYTFGSKATENTSAGGVAQTGVSRIAFYLTRDHGEHHNLFDPMIARGSTGNCIANDSSAYILDTDDHLYWKQVHVSSVSAANEITISTEEPNLHTGGLVKVNGVIYRISSVTDGNKIKIGDKGESLNIGVAVGDNIEFALANVVDNPIQEGDGSSKNSAGYWTNGALDDGDLMVESLVKQGTTWTWEASINSKNIEDGIAELHYVVFDKAGNAAIKSVDVTISNNRPRIAGMTFSTDDDANGSYSSSEIYSFHNKFANGKRGGKDVTSVMFTPNDDETNPQPLATVRNSMKIEPEVVGGNGELSYSMAVYKSTGSANWATSETGAFGSTSFGVNGTIDDSVKTLSIEKDVWDMIGAGIADENNQKLTVTITDNTIGGNMSADFSMILNFAIKDETAPAIKIRPFYWNSKDSNSLYQNKTTNGHIELSGDLPETKFGNSSGEFDKDPKVSGKVRIEGVAWDNAMLKKIALKINDTVSTILTYDNGTWSPETSLPEGLSDVSVELATFKEVKDSGVIPVGANITIPTDVDDSEKVPYISQEYGHIVKWSAVLDTASVFGSVAGLDNTVVALVWDRGSPAATHGQYTGEKTVDADTVQSGGSDGTGDYKNYYKMDVVPYITEVTRNTKFNTNRARSGAVSLLRGEASNVIKGFNLGTTTNTTVEISPNKDGSGTTNVDMTNVVLSGSNLTFTVRNTAKSGYLHVVVNGVTALNNMNGYKDYNTETNAKAYDHNTLTDDRYVHIWRVTKQDTFKGSKNAVYPAMARGSDGTLYASFTNYGQSKTYYTKSFVGNGTVTVSSYTGTSYQNHDDAIQSNGVATLFWGYDPPEETDIVVGADGDVNVFYAANYQGGSSGSWSGTAPSNAGGLYVYDTHAKTTQIQNNDKWAKIYRSELYTYDNELNQFRNIRITRSGSYIYVAYYDRLRGSIKTSVISDSDKPQTDTNGLPWVTIDGDYDNDDSGSGSFSFAGGWKPFLNENYEGGLTRTNGTGESVSITTNTYGYPVLLYMDANTGCLRIARASSANPTSAAKWTVQGVFASDDENYNTASDYMSCKVDSQGYLHIAFQNTKGQLVYAKSTNNPSNGTTAYTFGASQVLDDSGMWIDMTMNGTTPYISYLSRVNSYDGMKIAYYNANFDENNDGVAEGGWETMTAAMDAKVTNVRTCIAPNAKAYDGNIYTAAVGYCPGLDYRAAFYVGQ